MLAITVGVNLLLSYHYCYYPCLFLSLSLYPPLSRTHFPMALLFVPAVWSSLRRCIIDLHGRFNLASLKFFPWAIL